MTERIAHMHPATRGVNRPLWGHTAEYIGGPLDGQRSPTGWHGLRRDENGSPLRLGVKRGIPALAKVTRACHTSSTSTETIKENLMGDRANIYLEMPGKGNTPSGIYLYTHWSGHVWPECLREALSFGRGRWNHGPYLARIIASRVFSNLVDDEIGGGISLRRCDNEHPIIVCDLINQQVSFADEGEESKPSKRRGLMSFSDYVKQDQADYPSKR